MILFWATVRHAFRQRAVIVGVIAFAVAMLVHVHLTYNSIGSAREARDQLDAGKAEIEWEGCEGSSCTYPTVCTESLCYGVDLPIEGLKSLSRMSADERRTALEARTRSTLTELIEREESALSPRKAFRFRAEMASVGTGVFFAVLLTATLLGRDWRWRVWPTMVSQESRRGRLLAAKIGSAIVVVAAGYMLSLIAVTALDAARLSDLEFAGSDGPSLGALAGQLGFGLLALSTYACIAAAAVTLLRSSLPGLIVPFGLLIADMVLSTRADSSFRHVLPAQSVVGLTQRADPIPFGRLLWATPTPGEEECRMIRGHPFCDSDPLPLIPVGRATLTLIIWIAVACFLAAMAMRRRDIPT